MNGSLGRWNKGRDKQSKGKAGKATPIIVRMSEKVKRMHFDINCFDLNGKWDWNYIIYLSFYLTIP